jgi:D-aminoacyl-tRNA deacylase
MLISFSGAVKVAVIISKYEADQNIAVHLRSLFGGDSFRNISVHSVDKESPFCDDIDKEIDADLFVFATKHQSESGRPSLTCHAPGNWNKAEFGGKEKMLCVAPAFYLKKFFLELKKYEEKVNAEITLEATHHGPLLETPCMFVEIGSSLKEWVNPEYGRIIAECIMNVFTEEQVNVKPCFFIGGGHYNQSADKSMVSEYAVGHICPKYALEHLNKDMILQAVNKTLPKAQLVLLDWKGMGKEKERIIKLLDVMKIRYERSNLKSVPAKA